MTRPAPRIPRSVAQGKRKPNPRLRPQHRAFIRTLPCIACGKPGPSECAHIRSSGDGGMGIKPADRYTIPLCTSHHREQHQIGETEFFARLGIDPLGYACRLWAVSGDDEAGQRTIDRALMAIALNRRTNA